MGDACRSGRGDSRRRRTDRPDTTRGVEYGRHLERKRDTGLPLAVGGRAVEEDLARRRRRWLVRRLVVLFSDTSVAVERLPHYPSSTSRPVSSARDRWGAAPEHAEGTITLESAFAGQPVRAVLRACRSRSSCGSTPASARSGERALPGGRHRQVSALAEKVARVRGRARRHRFGSGRRTSSRGAAEADAASASRPSARGVAVFGAPVSGCANSYSARWIWSAGAGQSYAPPITPLDLRTGRSGRGAA